MWCYVVYFDFPVRGVPAVEIYHVEFYDTYLANNFINETYFFQFEGVLAQFVNLTAVNQTLMGLSTLIESRNYVGSLFVVNSNFTNCTVDLSSALIAYEGLMSVA